MFLSYVRVALAAVLVLVCNWQIAQGQCHQGQVDTPSVEGPSSCSSPSTTGIYFQQNNKFRALISCVNNNWRSEQTSWEPDSISGQGACDTNTNLCYPEFPSPVFYGYVDGKVRFRMQAKDVSLLNGLCQWAPDYAGTFHDIERPGGCCETFCNVEEQCRSAGGEFATSTCACDLQPSPIFLDIAGDGLNLTDAAGGVSFDVLADGKLLQVGWTLTGSDDALLALDRNGNGRIDDGTELFGNRAPQPWSLTPNGFVALGAYDSNGDNHISGEDVIYGQLLLWRDINHNGFSEGVELTPLRDSGISSISLDYRESRRKDKHGNEFRYWAPVAGPGSRFAFDVFLVTAPADRRSSKVLVR